MCVCRSFLVAREGNDRVDEAQLNHPYYIYCLGGIAPKLQKKFLSYMCRRANEIQSVHQKSSTIDKLRTLRAMVEQDCPELLHDKRPDYSKIDEHIRDAIKQVLGIKSQFSNCYAALAVVTTDEEEWELVKLLFDTVRNGDIKDCKKCKKFKKDKEAQAKKLTKKTSRRASKQAMSIKHIEAPDVHSGTLMKVIYTGLARRDRMRFLGGLVDGDFSYQQVQKEANDIKKVGTILSAIGTALGYATFEEVRGHIHAQVAHTCLTQQHSIPAKNSRMSTCPITPACICSQAQDECPNALSSDEIMEMVNQLQNKFKISKTVLSKIHNAKTRQDKIDLITRVAKQDAKLIINVLNAAFREQNTQGLATEMAHSLSSSAVKVLLAFV